MSTRGAYSQANLLNVEEQQPSQPAPPQQGTNWLGLLWMLVQMLMIIAILALAITTVALLANHINDSGKSTKPTCESSNSNSDSSAAVTEIQPNGCNPADKFFGGTRKCYEDIPDADTWGMTGYYFPRAPILEVPDYNGDGCVDNEDLALVKAAIGRAIFRPNNMAVQDSRFDRDGDCDLDHGDFLLTQQAMGTVSPTRVQQIAKRINSFAWVGDIRGTQNFLANNLFPIPVPLQGHATHWFTQSGLLTMQGYQQSNFSAIEGLNINSEEETPSNPARAHGLMWPGFAMPLFNDTVNGLHGILDFVIPPTFCPAYPNPADQTIARRLQCCLDNGWKCGNITSSNPTDPALNGGVACPMTNPTGCWWMQFQTEGFANPAPFMTEDTQCESWHVHNGLCMYINASKPSGCVCTSYTNCNCQGDAWQHMSFVDCLQAWQTHGSPSAPWMVPGTPFENAPFLWANFWMVHFWMFSENPIGLFAGWNPVLSLRSPSETTINSYIQNLPNHVIPAFAAQHTGIANPCCLAVGVRDNECCESPSWRSNVCCACSMFLSGHEHAALPPMRPCETMHGWNCATCPEGPSEWCTVIVQGHGTGH